MTTLPDKDAPVEQTLERIKEIFAQFQLSLDTAAEYHPLSSCWSHHIVLNGCEHLCTNGKGATREASLASGFAEMVERFITGALFSEYALQRNNLPFYFHPYERRIFIKKPQQLISKQKVSRLLTPQLLSFYDPEKELTFAHLMDSNYDDKERGIVALPFTSLAAREQQEVWFPAALLDNLYATNGMAAGNSRWECMNQAICEIFERYVKYRVIAEGVALPDIPVELIKQYPGIMEYTAALRDAGCSLWIKDASLGGQFPVVCVLLLDPVGGAFASFGCNCRLQVALERAVTEMLQGRQLSKLQGFPRPETMMDVFADSTNLEQHFINSEGFVPLRLFREQGDRPFADDFWQSLEKNRGEESKSEHLYLCQLVEQAGYKGYKMEYDLGGFSVCRIVIPQMSEIYPPDELVWNNRNRGSWLRTALLKLPRLKEKKLCQFTERLERADFAAEEHLSSLIGVAFAEKSVWGQLRIGELKALLYLAIFSRQQGTAAEIIETIESARNWCRWVVEFSGIESKRRRIYILIEQLLAIAEEGESLQDYSSFFSASFSEEEVLLAKDILGGKKRFWGLVFGESWEDIFPEYKKILEVFGRLQQAGAILSNVST